MFYNEIFFVCWPVQIIKRLFKDDRITHGPEKNAIGIGIQENSSLVSIPSLEPWVFCSASLATLAPLAILVALVAAKILAASVAFR